MRVLLLAATSSYRTDAFVAAAKKLGAEAIVGSDRCHVLDGILDFTDGSLALDLRHAEIAAQQIVNGLVDRPVDAIVPTNDQTAHVAALAARALGLAANPPDAAYRARNKRRMRESLRAAGVDCPRFVCAPMQIDADDLMHAVEGSVGFPCVLKPLLLSGSRGVMRADDRDSLRGALARLRAILEIPEQRPTADDDPDSAQILVEEFIPGAEVAVEGLLADGRFFPLAIFDKPDPLDGPFFEETIYVTPSRHPAETQAAIVEATARAARAMGLVCGPVHAELRLPPAGPPSVIEVAARTIGGLCGRTLRFSLGESQAGDDESATLEELVVGLALGTFREPPSRSKGASGVMMLPIPQGGVLRSVEGEDRARAVPGIVDLAVTARPGERLVPLPEGASYLGFLFARGETPAAVEASLRAAHGELRFEIAPLLT